MAAADHSDRPKSTINKLKKPTKNRARSGAEDIGNAVIKKPKLSAHSVEPVDPACVPASKRDKKSRKPSHVHGEVDANKAHALEDEAAQKAAGDTVQAAANVQDQLRSHRSQLEALKERDPEFYAYLAESDKALLEFSDDELDRGVLATDSDSGDEAEDRASDQRRVRARADAEGDEGGDGQQSSGTSPEQRRVTTATAKAWCAAATADASPAALRRVLRTFRAACHLGDGSDSGAGGADDLRIMSDAAFQHVLVFTLKEADGLLRKLLGLGKDAPLTDSALKSAKGRKCGPLAKSYLGNALHLLAHLAEEHTSAFILRRTRVSLSMLVPFDALQRRYLRVVVNLFSAARSRKVRVQALLWLRAAATVLPARRGDVLRGAYRAYGAAARGVTAAAMPDLAFMVAGIVELFGLDPAASYDQMFAFVAQLAVLLRNALTQKTADAVREVYCWRTVNCLELWAHVLAVHIASATLRPLVYPVAQLLLGVARLVPSPRWFPLRLRLVRALHALAAASGNFVPTAAIVLEVLTWPELAKSARGTGAGPDLLMQLRLSKANLKSPAVQQEIVAQAMELLAGSMALLARNPGFPEMAHLPMLSLKAFAKTTPVDRFRSQARLLLDALDANVRFVGERRDAIDFAPTDTEQVAAFLRDVGDEEVPLLAYAKRLAAKAADKRAAKLATHGPMAEVATPGPGSEDEERDEPDSAELLPKVRHSETDGGGDGVPQSTRHADGISGESEGDVLEDYIVSDDEEDLVDDDGPSAAMSPLDQKHCKDSHGRSGAAERSLKKGSKKQYEKKRTSRPTKMGSKGKPAR